MSSSGVKTLIDKQSSSSIAPLPRSNVPCSHVGPNAVASRVPVHTSAGAGGINRSSPIGGLANGIPRNSRVFPATLPCSFPSAMEINVPDCAAPAPQEEPASPTGVSIGLAEDPPPPHAGMAPASKAITNIKVRLTFPNTTGTAVGEIGSRDPLSIPVTVFGSSALAYVVVSPGKLRSLAALTDSATSILLFMACSFEVQAPSSSAVVGFDEAFSAPLRRLALPDLRRRRSFASLVHIEKIENQHRSVDALRIIAEERRASVRGRAEPRVTPADHRIELRPHEGRTVPDAVFDIRKGHRLRRRRAASPEARQVGHLVLHGGQIELEAENRLARIGVGHIGRAVKCDDRRTVQDRTQRRHVDPRDRRDGGKPLVVAAHQRDAHARAVRNAARIHSTRVDTKTRCQAVEEREDKAHVVFCWIR